MTNLEKDDWEKSRWLYKSYTSVGTLILGFLSFRLRRASFGAVEQAGVTRENHLPLYMLNDLIAAALGFCLGQFLSQDYIYKHRTYVIERMEVERVNNWNEIQRRPKDAPLLEEYPLKDYVSESDTEILEQRLTPIEQD